MPSEPTPPPLAKEQEQATPPPQVQEQTVPPPVAAAVTLDPPRVRFSILRWATTGVIRLLYRCWTRVAARLCPEDSVGERIATTLHIPLPDRLNVSWVTDNLAVGGRVRPDDIKALAHAGVTHVVDTRSEYCDDREALAQQHITLLHLPAPDTYPLTVEQLMEGAAWVQQQLQQSGRVLIHCEHGVGRSVLLTCAALVYNGMHAHDALQLVQQKRWQAAPNHRQVGRLEEFERYCRSNAKA